MPGPTNGAEKPADDDNAGLAAYFALEAGAMGVEAPLFANLAVAYSNLALVEALEATVPSRAA